MGRRVTADIAKAWFRARTSGAPEALRARAERFFDAAAHEDLVERFAVAGRAALAEASVDGATRPAALDLLAADALITLALLRSAEDDPARLGGRAAALRREVMALA